MFSFVEFISKNMISERILCFQTNQQMCQAKKKKSKKKNHKRFVVKYWFKTLIHSYTTFLLAYPLN